MARHFLITTYFDPYTLTLVQRTSVLTKPVKEIDYFIGQKDKFWINGTAEKVTKDSGTKWRMCG